MQVFTSMHHSILYQLYMRKPNSSLLLSKTRRYRKLPSSLLFLWVSRWRGGGVCQNADTHSPGIKIGTRKEKGIGTSPADRFCTGKQKCFQVSSVTFRISCKHQRTKAYFTNKVSTSSCKQNEGWILIPVWRAGEQPGICRRPPPWGWCSVFS